MFVFTGNHGLSSRTCEADPILGATWSEPQVIPCGEFEIPEVHELAEVLTPKNLKV